MSISISDDLMTYLFGLCRSYPDEYVQTCILEFSLYHANQYWKLTTDSPLIRLLVDITKECKPNSMVSSKVLYTWLVMTIWRGPRDILVGLCRQDDDFMQALLDILRYPEYPEYNTEGLTPINSHADIRGAAALKQFYCRLLDLVPEFVDILQRFWPFITEDGRLVSYYKCLSSVQQMNTEEGLTKSSKKREYSL
jgi:hypothetical protein